MFRLVSVLALCALLGACHALDRLDNALNDNDDYVPNVHVDSNRVSHYHAGSGRVHRHASNSRIHRRERIPNVHVDSNRVRRREDDDSSRIHRRSRSRWEEQELA